MAVIISMKQLLESGVHFGHQTRRCNPKMKKYIFTKRNGIHIIDLQKTVKMFKEAYNFIKNKAKDGCTILFVGTKKQSKTIICEEAKRIGQYYINSRWLGGTLTNWKTIQKSIKRFKKINEMKKDGTFKLLTKKEIIILNKEFLRLNKFLCGIVNMQKIPDLIYIVDIKKEHIAVKEAIKLNIPIIAMIDTNCDPDNVNIKIPANDDAIRAVKLITSKISDAFLEGINLNKNIKN